ncbi:hypothetical protein OW701_04970 [Acinetobacter baumannii]|uniref:hypothetical protein n=1 Tax=Acinetobacter baumannii TaxID=470 RepID=UPI00233E7873|nr:hypothetical protein [Acinetobacter baumannii]MDC4833849.1 hypothetical protein [Acinetobacter baumannii]MDC5298074.1 hypothetical protein [Acinetobacter baumannii]MDC5470985.1 hypothetical protein [Acinetobacter baumannii]MDK2184813.1 hypothetical protein [Acinetobacter baumannii]MDK2257622.1 hypothetical protein [Acinetobacter baumannii]
MAKKDLKNKIELTIFWLGLFCLIYLIFGFILKSDLTKPIDSSIFYEVLKDSLTITAAFLAPIAAFILFSDWRENHRLVRNEKEVDDLFKKIRSGDLAFHKFISELANQADQNNMDVMDQYFVENGILKENIIHLLTELERINARLQDTLFYGIAKKILLSQYELTYKISSYLEKTKILSLEQSDENFGKKYNAYNEFNKGKVQYQIIAHELILKLKKQADDYII